MKQVLYVFSVSAVPGRLAHVCEPNREMDKKHKIKRKSSKWKDPFPSGWEWERWVPVMAGHNEVAFHSTKWNRFLRMNSNGKMDASHERNIHDLVDWMTWERFRVVQLGGKIALYNTHHKKFVQMSHGNAACLN